MKEQGSEEAERMEWKKLTTKSPMPGNTILVKYCFVSVVERELTFGDHCYARRNPLPGVEEEDADKILQIVDVK